MRIGESIEAPCKACKGTHQVYVKLPQRPPIHNSSHVMVLTVQLTSQYRATGLSQSEFQSRVSQSSRKKPDLPLDVEVVGRRIWSLYFGTLREWPRYWGLRIRNESLRYV